MYRKGSVMTAIVVLLMLGGAIAYYTVGDRLIPKLSVASSTTSTTSDGLLPKLPSIDEVFLSSLDKCESLTTALFTATKKREIDQSPIGPVEGYWNIQFKEGGRFSWKRSDVGENGTYTCAGNVLKIRLFDRSLTAFYDPGKETLTWEGMQYTKTK